MKCELCSLSRKSNCDLLFHYYAHYLLYHYQKTESGLCPDKSFHALARGNDDFLDFCRDIKSPSLDKGWPDEKFQNDFKKICRDQKPLGPIWLFLDKCGKNLETLFDEIRFRCTIDIRREIFSIVNESNARFEGKQNDGIYRCNQQHESKSGGCDYLTIYPTELMIHLEWHACKDKPVDDSFKLKRTDETFTKHPAYNASGIELFSILESMLQSGRIRNPRLQGDSPLFRSKLATIRSGYYQKFGSKNTPPLPELKAKLKNRLKSQAKRRCLGRFLQEA